MNMCLYLYLDPSQFRPSLSFYVLPGPPAPAGLLSTSSVSGSFSVYGLPCPSMSFQVPQLLLACCQPYQCLDPSQFMAFLVLSGPSRSPSSCWLAVNLISVCILLSLWPSLSFLVLPGPPAPAGLLSTS